jgi:uncharacterized repeat protein (TIGR03803 family)
MEFVTTASWHGHRSALMRLIIGAFAFTAAGGLARAQTAIPEAVIYNFNGGTDGASPRGGVIFDTDGNLYGTTRGGGSGNQGTVFKLTPPKRLGAAWTEEVLHRFTGSPDGADPESEVLFRSGKLYGTTYGGGASNLGTIYELAPPTVRGGVWTARTIYSFTGGANGAHPIAGLIADTSGNLYGTTVDGNGTVFKLTSPGTVGGDWTRTTLHVFSGADGGYPLAGLIFDATGNLYGVTEYGGASGNGTVFRLAPPTSPGGDWITTTIYSFGGGADGAFPAARLVFDTRGNLYGTTYQGGSSAYNGTVFKLTAPAWNKTTYSFTGANGSLPWGDLVFDSGSLYGTTQSGGPGNGAGGTVFKITPPDTVGGAWAETVLHSFGGGSDGSTPLSGVTFSKKGNVYGTTANSGASGNGVVYGLALYCGKP